MPTEPSNSPAKRVNWEIAKECLAQIDREAPSILQQGVIIGGIACWFYRNLLAEANDPEFRVPDFSAEDELFWLSKDIDFTNFFSEDARRLLKGHVEVDQDGRRALKVGGIPIGFAQVGLTFDPETAWADSWVGEFLSDGSIVEFRVLNPISLYREKTSLVQRRGAKSDAMHLSVVTEFLKCEVCRNVSALAAAKNLDERAAPSKFLMAIRDLAIEVCRDRRVSSRIQSVLVSSETLSPFERQILTMLTMPSA